MYRRAGFGVLFGLLLLISVTNCPLIFAAGPAPDLTVQQGADPQFPRIGEPIKPDPETERKMAKARQKERYESLKRDTGKLLELATELKQQVEKGNENVLSMDVVKKCEEIEKLAKSVRTKMRGD